MQKLLVALLWAIPQAGALAMPGGAGKTGSDDTADAAAAARPAPTEPLGKASDGLLSKTNKIGLLSKTNKIDAGLVVPQARRALTEDFTGIRLADGPTIYEGRVEVFDATSGLWGTVCDDDWDLEDAKVVCQKIHEVDAIVALYSAAFGEGSGAIWMDDLECEGTESDLWDCDYDPVTTDCDHDEDAAVVCDGAQETPPLVNVRLVGGTNVYEGRVEVFNDAVGKWGTVCDDDFGLEEAQVVCQQIHGVDAIVASRSAAFGEGSGAIWMDDLECEGTESDLWTCPGDKSADGSSVSNCDHGEDAGVVCEDPCTAICNQRRLRAPLFGFYSGCDCAG